MQISYNIVWRSALFLVSLHPKFVLADSENRPSADSIVGKIEKRMLRLPFRTYYNIREGTTNLMNIITNNLFTNKTKKQV